ncbi:MAG TPA: thymidylate synthase [Bryobacteraceae bacterium]|nr:thymidylate synthase [Bryobacteraceae bacterium]
MTATASATDLLFDPLFFADRLIQVNPHGDVGVVTLWSNTEQARKVISQAGVDVSAETSRIAAIGNLFGNGLPELLRNLLYNPQIQCLIIMGQDLSGSRQELINFFELGIEPVDYLGTPSHRVVGTNRIIDGMVTPDMFAQPVKLVPLGLLSDPETAAGLRRAIDSLPKMEKQELLRRDVPIPKAEVQRFPSEPRNHNILRPSPVEAWRELIFRLVRFGHRSKLRKGDKIELQNVKVVIEEPVEEDQQTLGEYGFSLEHFHEYQERMLDGRKPPDLIYTYGNRMRGYFQVDGKPIDGLQIMIERLREDPESRHAYMTLWDNATNLVTGAHCPCLVSIFFRKFEQRLTLTATFRTHNAMDAWLENVYGLMAIQRYVAEGAGMQPGAITVFSHSISVDAGMLEKAKSIAKSKTTDHVVSRETGKVDLRFDPNGEFTVTVDQEAGEVVVQHSWRGARINEYRGTTAEALENQLARDAAISEISHALYLGREIARKEAQLKALRTKMADASRSRDEA